VQTLRATFSPATGPDDDHEYTRQHGGELPLSHMLSTRQSTEANKFAMFTDSMLGGEAGYICHELLADFANVLRQGRREHHHLLLAGSLLENCLNVFSHVCPMRKAVVRVER